MLSAAEQRLTTINFAIAMLGVALLAMPYCFAQCGVLLGTALLLVLCYLAHDSVSLLIRCAHTKKLNSLQELMGAVYGPLGKTLCDILVMLLLLGSVIGALVISGDVVPSVFEAWRGLDPLQTRTPTLLFLAYCIALPLALLRDLSALSMVSLFALFFNFFFVLVLALLSLANHSSHTESHPIVWVQWSGITKVIPIFTMGFCCQPQLFAVLPTLNDHSFAVLENVTGKSIKFVSFLFISSGLFGYFAFFQNPISGDILNSLSADSSFQLTLKIVFCLTGIFAIPLLIFPIRFALFSILSLSLNNVRAHYVSSFGILSFCVGIAILIPEIQFLLFLNGSSVATIFFFFIPALLFRQISPSHTNSLHSPANVLLLIGCTGLALSVYGILLT